MDALSEILNVVKLAGALFFNGEFSAPWRLWSKPVELAPLLAPPGSRLVIFHFLTEGRAYAQLAGGRRVDLAAGEIVIVPHGDEHWLGAGSPERTVDSLRTFGAGRPGGLNAVRFGGGGEVTRFVCGFLACEPRLSDVFLAGLPPLLKARLSDGRSGEWVGQAIRSAVAEVNTGAGGALVLARMAEVLFIETLRRYIQDLPAEETGWLAGAREPAVGQALALLHKEPAREWTLADLARGAGVSRTALAERFRLLLGKPPMAYLAHWRLKLSAGLLLESAQSVAEIAAAVGYGSEAAFNRAFKREFDCPPAQYRRTRGKARAQAQ
jgi:AraC-like DNA-binding protein